MSNETLNNSIEATTTLSATDLSIKNSPLSPSLSGLQQLYQQSQSNNISNKKRVIPPVEKWSPAYCGEMNLVIRANGEWWHEGKKMTRQSLIDLFASVLWAEVDNQGNFHYFLKTPVEKIGIQVEDVPLFITQVDKVIHNDLPVLQLTTSNGDIVIVDNEHPIILQKPANVSDDTLLPYVLVRKNGDSTLFAKIHRNVFFHLIEMGELLQVNDVTQLILVSGQHRFVLSMVN